MKMLNCLVVLLLCLLAKPLSGQKSLFESEIVGDENRKLNVGVNLPPKFLPGGDIFYSRRHGCWNHCKLLNRFFYFKQV
jgi:hypothetical protein